MAALPEFRYHRDPVASKSVVASDAVCSSCNQSRGFIYTGPVYAEEELEDALCPWCIADGSAHEKFDATFVDTEAFADGTAPEVIATISERTPGFNAWQSERWLSCCGEPAAFVGPADSHELATTYQTRLDGTLMTYIVQELHISGGAANQLLRSLHKDHSPTAFVFQCLHCDFMPAYVDAS